MPQKNITSVAVRGLSWMMLNTFISRIVVLLSQLILGYLLIPSDFGLYAIALSITNSLSAIRNGGTPQLLVNKGEGYKKILSKSTQYSLIFNVAAFFSLLIIAPITNHYISHPDLIMMCVAIGLSFPLGTFGTVYRIELSIQGRFKEVATLNTWSTIMWQAEVITLASLGFGAYSYAIPMVLQSLMDGALGWHFVREWPISGSRIRWADFVSLFKETKWIMLGAAMLSIGLTGHYFAAGLFADVSTVGYFFFGFQIAYTLFVLMNNAIESVLPAVFSRANNDQTQQSRMVMDILSILLVVSIPVSVGLMLAASPIIKTLWHGRWDSSVIVIKDIALCIPAWVIIAIYRAVLEARGLWRSRFLLLTVYGLGTFVVVAISAFGSNLNRMSLSLLVFYSIMGLLLLARLSRLLNRNLISCMSMLLKPLLVSLVCYLVAIVFGLFLPGGNVNGFRVGLAESSLFLILSIIMNIAFFGDIWHAAFKLAKGEMVESID